MESVNTFILRFGGRAFYLGGILFIASFLLLNLVPPLPDDTSKISGWLFDAKTMIAVSNELTLFASLCLIPGTYSLFTILYYQHPLKAFLGTALLLIMVILFVILVIVQGRLCYPVLNIDPTSGQTQFILSMYWGFLHMIFLIAGIVNVIYGLIFYNHGKHLYLALSIVFFFNNMVGSFPWLIGRGGTLTTQIGFCLWFMMMGTQLLSPKSLFAS